MKRYSMGIAASVAPWLLAASVPSFAVSIYNWNIGNCASGGSLITSCTDTTTNPTGGGTLTYSAISDSGATIGGQRSLAAAYVGNYNPTLGVTTRSGPNAAATSCNSFGQQECTAAPQHAMDNVGNSEFMLLSFASAVSLQAVQLGYESVDSDITVLAYTGAAGGQSPLGKTYNTLAGWSFIGNYSDAYDTTTNVSGFGSQVNTVAINSGAVSSSYWLIGAYNSKWGTSNSGTVGALTTGNDYVKLLASYGCVSGSGTTQCGGGGGGGSSAVPEPSTVLLVSVALLGLTGLRRRRVA